MLLNQKCSVTSLKKPRKTAFSWLSYKYLDLKDQISCCQTTFWNVNNFIQEIYIVNHDSLLHIISFRLIIIKMNLQLPFILYILSFNHTIFGKNGQSGL